jgi:hypothetical protein
VGHWSGKEAFTLVRMFEVGKQRASREAESRVAGDVIHFLPTDIARDQKFERTLSICRRLQFLDTLTDRPSLMGAFGRKTGKRSRLIVPFG